MALITEKIELLAPIPRANEAIATMAKPRPRTSRRTPNRRS